MIRLRTIAIGVLIRELSTESIKIEVSSGDGYSHSSGNSRDHIAVQNSTRHSSDCPSIRRHEVSIKIAGSIYCSGLIRDRYPRSYSYELRNSFYIDSVSKIKLQFKDQYVEIL